MTLYVLNGFKIHSTKLRSKKRTIRLYKWFLCGVALIVTASFAAGVRRGRYSVEQEVAPNPLT